jgi:hypothetical protein
MYIDLYFNILLRKITTVESSYGIHNNTNCTRTKFDGTFPTFPCKLYWSCSFNWKIWANARWGAITHSYIVLSIETNCMLDLLFIICSCNVQVQWVVGLNFFWQYLQIFLLLLSRFRFSNKGEMVLKCEVEARHILEIET